MPLGFLNVLRNWPSNWQLWDTLPQINKRFSSSKLAFPIQNMKGWLAKSFCRIYILCGGEIAACIFEELCTTLQKYNEKYKYEPEYFYNKNIKSIYIYTSSSRSSKKNHMNPPRSRQFSIKWRCSKYRLRNYNDLNH